MARKYTLNRRAQKQAETRERILDAVINLHEELGPAQTSISAIAERAGVQRLTVYRHFPDEPALFDACRDHWFDLNPMPDPEAMRVHTDPLDRLYHSLLTMYAYFERTERMTANVMRDAVLSETVANAMQPSMEHFGRIYAVLVDGWNVSGEQQTLLNAVIGHAIDFSTWQSLARRQGLDATRIARLMTCLAGCALDQNSPA